MGGDWRYACFPLLTLSELTPMTDNITILMNYLKELTQGNPEALAHIRREYDIEEDL
jgi:hypothetical protein